jgi:hypothetical protein
MKIQKMRRSILHFSSCFITFGVACAADPGAPVSEQHAVSNVYLGMELPQANAVHAE